MFYIISPRLLSTGSSTAQMQPRKLKLPKDFSYLLVISYWKISKKAWVQHDSPVLFIFLFYRFLIPPLGYTQHVVLSLTRFHEYTLISWREMKKPYHAAFSFKLKKILYTEWSG